ncbi:hypothetical protein JQX09_24225 [Sulfitobacter pseudonitzschiae]|uniref:Uncharacterized protein n=1 Tax=Pseudosulfitobacter pseudonitzschiae TaxID=1402135 RepID=A0A9Q2RXJ7_9RHOB|nr:hypothetical protein [Pseudosulfitobacter pseudonitzschiae]MBM2295035.1 hypothetical protein [Pseudosulfitobacter pseudonitzschiae]MBM2299937.1 hypothetical protein [Pseudosulfitobacter pseudonitzschiae]MBM2304873.1 hypothetical protein [Pseudosulfitobacter pseudonitzschiae]MBM2314646.1 hypothetical protein [Pseudosulfitobacter pseudonitzschiae]MBM2319556.1 hypothetical protein [Pseudosulfitobacter pseudonitzschiae]
MGNIITFPTRCDAVDHQEFLQDGGDTLQFVSAGEQKKGQEHTFPLPKNFTRRQSQEFRAKDWTNQEVAHLYRVKRLLDLAGVPNSIDRGVSDEGDPWFLFCDAADEVLIHLCRIDGVYLLDTPSIETPLHGRDFTQLVDAFLERKLQGQEEISLKEKHKVVRLGRNGKVLLHPSTMLAALVWTLFLESDDLVMVLPKDSGKIDGQSENPTSVPSCFDQYSTVETQNLCEDFLNLQEEEAARTTADTMPMYQSFRAIMSANNDKSLQNSYIIGLSAISISLGIVSGKGFLTFDDLEAESVLDLLNAINNPTDQNSNAVPFFGNNADEVLSFSTILEDIFADTTITSTEPIGSSDSDGHISAMHMVEDRDAVGSEQHVASKILTDLEARSREIHGEGLYSEKKAEIQVDTHLGINTNQRLTSNDSQALEKLSVYSNVGQLFSVLTKLVDVEKWTFFNEMSLRAYKIDNNTLYATFNIKDTGFDKTGNFLDSTSQASQPRDGLAPNSEIASLSDRPQSNQNSIMEASKFISYLLDKEGNLEIIALDKELIFVDLDVFDVASVDTYAMSWKIDNGETISVIGLQSSYADFALLA